MRKNKFIAVATATVCVASLILSGCGGKNAAPTTELSVISEEISAETDKDGAYAVKEVAENIICVDDPEHQYVFSAIRSDDNKTDLSRGDKKTLRITDVTIWTEDGTDGSGHTVYRNPVSYDNAEDLAEAGFYVMWCDYPGFAGDGSSPFGELSTDECFSTTDGYEITVTFPSAGNYWIQAVLVDEDGNAYCTEYYDEITVR